MNQILSTSMPKYDNTVKEKRDIKTEKILKIFAMLLIIFGICSIGTAAYTFYQNQVEAKALEQPPVISIENKTDKIILLKVTHNRNINKVEYSWNDDNPIVVSGRGQYVEAEIRIPSGENILHIVVQDEYGKEETYDKEYEIESNINLEVVGDKIRVTYNNNIDVSYITYRWDEDEEEKVAIHASEVEEEISVKSGLHKLTVVVVDKNNNTDTKVQKINGVSKPTIELGIDEDDAHFVIKALADNSIITRMEVILDKDNTNIYFLDLKDKNYSEFDYTLPLELHEGENFIEVTITNKDGLTETATGRYAK